MASASGTPVYSTRALVARAAKYKEGELAAGYRDAAGAVAQCPLGSVKGTQAPDGDLVVTL